MQTQPNHSFHQAIQEFKYPHQPSLKVPFLPVFLALLLFVFVAGRVEKGFDRGQQPEVAVHKQPDAGVAVASSLTLVDPDVKPGFGRADSKKGSNL